MNGPIQIPTVADNDRRTADFKLLNDMMESRVTSTEWALLDGLRDKLSDISRTYVLPDEDRSWVEGLLSSPPRRDSVEAVLGQVYTACLWMHRGWHGKRHPSVDSEDGWLAEAVVLVAKLRRNPRDQSRYAFRETAIDLAALCVYAAIWGKDRE